MYDNHGIPIVTNDMVWIVTVALIVIWGIISTLHKKRSQSRPPSVEDLGRSSWTLLHTMASKYPHVPDINHQKEARMYLILFAKFYPCSQCSEHMMTYLRNHPPQLSNRHLLQKWLCVFHNDVNQKLGKPLFDCNNISSIHKRWGDNTCPAQSSTC